MAIVKLGALASDIIGKIGGTVYQRNSAGLCIRSQAGGVSSPSSLVAQNLSRSYSLQRAWLDLVPSQRAAWDVYANLRPRPTRKQSDKYMSGHAVFMLENNARLQLNTMANYFISPVLSVPTMNLAPATIDINSVTNTSGELRVATSYATNALNELLLVYMSRPVSVSSLSVNYPLLLMRKSMSDAAYQNYANQYLSLYGRLPAVGQRVVVGWYRYDIASLSLSPWQQRSFVVY